MIKTLLTAFSGLLFLTSGMAQITLTAASNFEIGYEYTASTYFEIGLDFDPGPEGANQTWDFSTVVGTNPATTTVQDVSALMYGNSFPEADAGFGDGMGNESFFSNTASAQSFWGAFTSSGLELIYTNPQDFLRFPFTFGDTYTDNFSGTATTSVEFNRMGSAEVTCDGYGTLITSQGTFNDVVRVKTVMEYGDFFGGSEIAHYSETRYYWYNATEPSTLMGVVLTDYGVGQQFSLVNILENSTSATKNVATLEPLELFPNPAQDFVTVNFQNKDLKHATLSIFNQLGQLVKRISIDDDHILSQSLTLDTGRYQNGTYQMVLHQNNVAVARDKFIILK